MLMIYKQSIISVGIAAILFLIWHGSGFAAEGKKLVPAGSKQGGVVNIKKGKEIYHERCAACHGIDGNPVLPTAPSFAKGERMEKSDKELLQTMKHGKNQMPAWKDILNAGEMKEVLTFARIVAGDKIFEEKCLKCHSRIPKLKSDVPDEKALKTFEGTLDICRSCEIEKEMTNEELIEVIRYLRTLGK